MKNLITFAFMFCLSCTARNEQYINQQEEIQTESACVSAQQHISSCLNIQETFSNECDEDAAETLLAMSCEDLEYANIGQKSDGSSWLDRLHCKVGVLHFCPVGICEEEKVEGSSCIDALQKTDCGQCSYYECLEEKAQCGEDGYLMNFVGKYCNRFTQVTYPRLSVFGKVWLEGVRECLISNMENGYYNGESCKEIEERGIEDHIKCYVNTGICSLPVSDWLNILGTIPPNEIPLRQAISVGNECIKDFLKP